MITSLLLSNGADPNKSDNSGFTPLMIACTNMNECIVSKLLECGADVNAQDEDGITALMIATAQCSERIVLKLIAFGLIETSKIGMERLHLPMLFKTIMSI